MKGYEKVIIFIAISISTLFIYWMIGGSDSFVNAAVSVVWGTALGGVLSTFFDYLRMKKELKMVNEYLKFKNDPVNKEIIQGIVTATLDDKLKWEFNSESNIYSTNHKDFKLKFHCIDVNNTPIGIGILFITTGDNKTNIFRSIKGDGDWNEFYLLYEFLKKSNHS